MFFSLVVVRLFTMFFFCQQHCRGTGAGNVCGGQEQLCLLPRILLAEPGAQGAAPAAAAAAGVLAHQADLAAAVAVVAGCGQQRGGGGELPAIRAVDSITSLGG